MSERICEQIVDPPVPQVVVPPIMEEVAACVHQDRRRVADELGRLVTRCGRRGFRSCEGRGNSWS